MPSPILYKFKQVRNETREEWYIAKEMMWRTQHSAEDRLPLDSLLSGKRSQKYSTNDKDPTKEIKSQLYKHNIKCHSVYVKLKARNGEKRQINCNMAFEGTPSSYLPIWKYKHHPTSNLENYGEIFKSKVPPKQTELSMSGHTHHKCMMIASVIKTLICFCVS